MNVASSKLTRFILMLLVGAGLAGIQGHAARAAENATSEVLEYHGNAARSGLYVVSALTWEAARHLQRDPNFQAEVAGPVYAQPLYWHLPGSTRALLLVATEQNLVYALDSQTGALVWKTSVGPPVPHSSLPCGNIDPLGITGTPVIDDQLQALFLGAMITDKASRAPRHLVFGLSLKVVGPPVPGVAACGPWGVSVRTEREFMWRPAIPWEPDSGAMVRPCFI